MKNTFLLCAALVLAAFPALAVTNVTITALPAVSSISGSELVPLVQGGATKNATVSQLQAAPTATANAVQAFVNAMQVNTNMVWLTGNFNSIITASNLLAAQVTASTNRIAELFGHTNDPVAYARLLGIGTMAGRPTNDFYLSSNPSGYQTDVQVSNTVTAALGTIGPITNGGNLTLATGTMTNLVTPTTVKTFSFPGPITTNLDLRAGTFQTLNINASGATTITLSPTNVLDGQNVNLLFVNVGAGCTFATPGTVPGFTIRGGGKGNVALPSGSIFLVNYVVFGTNIIYGSQQVQ